MSADQIRRDYESGELCGWAETRNPGLAREQFHLISGRGGVLPRLSISGQSREYAGKKMMLYQVCRQVLGADTKNYPQQIGDCVSFGAKNGAEYLTCSEILMQGERQKFRPVFPPFYYGTGRVYVGGGRLGNSDGSLGSWMAEAVQKYGTLFADDPDVPAYSGRIAKAWGDPRPGDDLDKFKDAAAPRLIRSAALIRTWEDLVAAIVNGYPCPTASNVGYSMEPSSDGFHRQTTSWSHQMCCPKGTLVAGDSFRAVEDVRVGDVVYGHDGKRRAVTRVHRRDYEGALARISTIGARPLRLTPNHPVLVYRRSRKEAPARATCGVVETTPLPSFRNPAGYTYEAVWVLAGDVWPGDYLLTPAIESKEEATLPEWIRPERAIKEVADVESPDDELAWLFGFYVGDGNVKKGHGICLTLSPTDPLDKVVTALRKLGVEPRVQDEGTYVRVHADSVILEKSFGEWFGKDSSSKRLPDWLFAGWNLSQVLSGLMQADGSWDQKRLRFVFTTTSRVLAEQVRLILASAGHFCSTCDKDNSGGSFDNASPMYELTWRPQSNDHQFRFRNGFVLHKVKSVILEHHRGPVFNFEVEGCHSYVADGFVVHNCFIGVDDNDKDPYALILNNWGDCHGKLKDPETGEDVPVGTLRVRRKDAEKHIRAGETYAYSNFEGTPEQDLEKELFKLIGK